MPSPFTLAVTFDTWSKVTRPPVGVRRPSRIGVDDTMSQTATPEEARAHARAQAATSTWDQATIPARAATDLPEGIEAATVVWDETIGAGGYAARAIPRGTRVRLTDVRGDACANVLVYNARRPAERLNVADTVKVQWQAYLGAGSLLLSDMGRVLMSVASDSCGEHDALCGASNVTRNAAKYGNGVEHGSAGVHGSFPDARDRFAVALAKFGLDRRDIVPNVNFFKHVRVATDGSLQFDNSRSRAGAYVELRAELPVLLVAANTPHVLDPRREYTVTELRITAWGDAPTTRADPLWSSTPEAERAFLNTEDLLQTDLAAGDTV
jgi:urea carboxylase-associated protein 2